MCLEQTEELAAEKEDGMNREVSFEFEGRKYRFDSVACYDGSGLVALPDGTVLVVTGCWFETYPPMPGGLRRAACGEMLRGVAVPAYRADA